MKTIFLMAIVALSLLSCSKVLDQSPQDRISAANFWKTANDAEAAVASLYDVVQSMSAQSPVAFDAGSDVAVALSTVANNNYIPFSQRLIPVDNAIVSNYWQNNYRGITRCNDLLKNVPSIENDLFSPGQKERVLAEAYFLRGYFYFNLIKALGKVPIVTVPYESFNADFTIDASTVDQVLDQIIADLKLAEPGLTTNYPNIVPATEKIDSRGRATKGAARALLSKVYLSKKDYSNAAAKALEVISDSTMYRLATGAAEYASIFGSNTKNSTEGIFEIQFVSSTLEGNNLFDIYTPGSGVPTGVQTGANYRVVPTTKIINAFETGDIRKAASVAFTTATTSLPYINKYIRLTAATSPTNEPNIIPLRLSDIILVRAEALSKLSQTAGAVSMLNIIRRRAFNLHINTPSVRDFPNANDLLNGYTLDAAIEHERMLELCFEGHRFYDLARTGRSTAVLGIDSKYTLWPIPLRELNRNPRLKQNDGY